MNKRFFLAFLFSTTAFFCFGQAGALREYVGLIKINYHQDIINLMNRAKENLEKGGGSRESKIIENYLEGARGTGFVYVAPNGANYILTNEHVVSNAERFSITFERQDGVTVVHEGLRILRIDEENDLAILYFESGARPFARGLTLLAAPADEGTTIYAAGFPSLGFTNQWQFTQGIISNASIRIPKDIDSTELMGPFIQHTAQIDPGNSGGPLLVARQGVPANYAVIGINTMSARWRQTANFAIPITRVNTFITEALTSPAVNQREIIEKRIEDFVKGTSANIAVYDHIAKFITNNCMAINAEFAILELLDNAPRNTIRDIDQIFSKDPAQGMRLAVAWYIEKNMRPRGGQIRITTDSITQNDKGFLVSFDINGKIIETQWIQEFGIYRMDTFGDITTGDKSLVEERRRRFEQDAKLKTDWGLLLNAGYAHVTYNQIPSINASFFVGSTFYYESELYYGLSNNNYTNLNTNIGLMYAFRLNSFAIIPFGGFGGGVIWTDDKDGNEPSLFDFNFNFNLKAGLMFAISNVPGLVIKAYYSHNTPFLNPNVSEHGIIGLNIGYAF